MTVCEVSVCGVRGESVRVRGECVWGEWGECVW